MNIGILGTGMVGTAIASKLISLGHNVRLGSRTSPNEKADAWVSKHTSNASAGTFKDAAEFGEVIFICTSGEHTLEAVESAGKKSFSGKTVIDVTNPLDFSKGMPPFLIPGLSNTNSLGEEIQKAIPDANVVKSLNTVNCEIMVNPGKLSEDTIIFVGGNNQESKKTATEILKSFGWKDIIDLGDITSSRTTEMIIPFWVKIMSTLNTAQFNFKIVK